MFERLLQINLAVLSVLGTLFLGFAQQNFFSSVMMIAAAFASLAFTDWIKWFRLTRPIANMAAILVVVVSIRDFWQSDSSDQLVAIANLLTYLQIVLLFQEKNDRLYWQLATLSFLQVVVSAAMNLGLMFGVLLVLYMGFGFTALTLFLAVRETIGFGGREEAKQTNGGEESALLPKSDSTAAWQRALGQAAEMQFNPSTSSLTAELLASGLPKQIAILMAATGLFAVTVFYAAPRIGGAAWQGARFGSQRTVGFSSRVSLSEMGAIKQDDSPALRVYFTDANTGAPYEVREDPYIRGAVLVRYGDDERRGSWGAIRQREEWPFPTLPDSAEMVRQEFRLESVRQDPNSELSLFSVFPAHRLSETSHQVRFEGRSGQAFRPRGSASRSQGFRYVLGTSGFRDGRQPVVIPDHRKRNHLQDTFPEDLRAELLRINPSRFPGLVELAEQVLADANAAELSPIRKAKILESHFLFSGRYQYSLDTSRRTRNRELDPIEDFIVNHKIGHCEYFASALVLMLRSQGIPARMIVGFHGGEFNSFGNYWLVRQRDAHAWVEAFVEPEDVAAQMGDSALLPIGGWLRLDPTPGTGDAASKTSEPGILDRFGDLLSHGEFLWREYVMELNAPRQQTSVFEPVSDQARTAFSELLDIESWRRWLRGESAWSFQNWTSREWFSWRAAVLAGGVSAFVFTLIAMVRQLIIEFTPARRLFRRLRRMVGLKTGDSETNVGFFARFEEWLERKGWSRDPTITPQEFVDQLTRESSEFRDRPDWVAAAKRIVGRFYQVRFGSHLLSADEIAEIEKQLESLESTENPPLSIDGR